MRDFTLSITYSNKTMKYFLEGEHPKLGSEIKVECFDSTISFKS